MSTQGTTDQATTFGSYRPSVLAGNWIFLSGQLGNDSQEKAGSELNLIHEFKTAIKKLQDLVSATPSAQLVQVTLYLTDLSEMPKLNNIYETMIGHPLPSRVTVGVSELPKGARVEISGIAYIEKEGI